MNKTIHLVCNAHLDPVWQWEWEEGAAEALSTFRTAVRFCKEFDGFIFCHNEAILYKWVEEYEPSLFREIQDLVKAGRWHIMCGWHLQPDCNMTSGEGIVRQVLAGRRYFTEKFGKAPTTAINFDPFGHSRGMVQILKKCGYDSYLFCRPADNLYHLESDLFVWEGYDGSRIAARRATESYRSALGKSVDKIRPIADKTPDGGINLVLWGVGDHGGGPSHKDLCDIAAYQKECEKNGDRVVHSTPEEYFAAVKAEMDKMPVVKTPLNPFAPGCYTSMVRVKQKYRLLENTLWQTEKMCAAAGMTGAAWPEAEFAEVTYDLLTAQFHDFLPGSSIKAAEDMAIRTLDHGQEILSRVRARAFFRLAGGQKKPAPDEIPVLLYNPHPYPIEGDFTGEMMLWDQNWEPTFHLPDVYDEEGNLLPTQCEKEQSNLNLDWRKRVAFHATLPPMSMSRFNCKYHIEDHKPAHTCPVSGDCFVFDNGKMRVAINRKTGLVDEYTVSGKPYLAKGAFRILVNRDNCDPWGMTVNSFEEKDGALSLMTDEAASAYCCFDDVIPAVRVIESGAVRTVIEALFAKDDCRAVVRYTMSNTAGTLGVTVWLTAAEPEKMYKLAIPTAFRAPTLVGDAMYGSDELPTDGRENVSQKYLLMKEGGRTLGVCNLGTYGSSAEGAELHLSLARTAGYCAHPISGRRILPDDRYSEHMDMETREYSFLLFAEEGEGNGAARIAQIFNEPPMSLAFFPSGEGTRPTPAATLSGDDVTMTVLKRAEDGNGLIARLFNPTGEDRKVSLTVGSARYDGTMTKYEIRTLRVTDRIAECGLDEK